MLRALEHKAADAARTAAMGLGAMVAICVGIAFLTLAAWLYLTSVGSALLAALIIGLAYTGLGLLAVAVIGSPSPPARPHAAPDHPTPSSDTAPMVPVVHAFLEGVQAGAKARRPTH